MAALALKLTDAGLAAVQGASGSDPVVISALGLTATPFAYAPTLTALPGEFKRIAVESGTAAAANITHLTAYDTSADVWSITGFGLFMDDGVLFAVYTGDAVVMNKAGLAFGLIALDIAFEADLAGNISYGNAVFTWPPATEGMRGVARLATQARVSAAADGEDDAETIVTPKTLRSRLAGLLTAVNAAIGALGESLTAALDGEATIRANADAALHDDVATRLPAASYTAEDVRAKLVTVDGDGSAIDADMLDGHHGTEYERIVEESLVANNGYTVYASGKKECWGSVTIAAGVAVIVPLPKAHDSWFIVSLGSGLRSTSDAQNNTAVQAWNGVESFTLRNWENVAVRVDWSTKGV
jgi:hypothetical protein